MAAFLIFSMVAAGVDVTPAEMQDVQQWTSGSLTAEQAQPFFSFVYSGKPSSEFLPGWNVTSDTRQLDDARTGLTTTFADPATGLEVRCEAVRYANFPTVEWTLYFRNAGSSDTPVIENIQPLDTVFTHGDNSDFILHSNAGDNCTQNSYEPRAETLAAGAEKRIANTGGRPTQEAFPYFNIEWGGRGAIVVVSWAGQWAATFARDTADTLRVRAGQELTHFVLHPGEEVRTPLVVLQFWRGDWTRAQNVWRRWMLAHNVPQPGGKPLGTQLSLCTGNFYPNLMTESKQERAFLQRHLDERIPFDCWWQDAGWYPCDGVGWPKVGTWEVDPGRFPKGLRELSDLMHENGKKTMVWFEPERVHADTWLTTNHPEWVYGGAGGGLLKLGEPACRAWLTDHIDAILTSQAIDDYRQDFNMDPLPFWRAADTEDRQGISEIRHVEGYFAYWDELRRRHPNMLIDSCASGGRRNDLETLRRAVPLLRSDWYWGAAGQQCQTFGLSMWVPYHGTGFIYQKDEYWVRSCMTAENSFGPDSAGLDNVDFAELRRLTAQCKEIQPYFLGDFWPLTPYTLDESVWMAWQFNRPEHGDGIVQVFRRAQSPYTEARFCLQDLDAAATYQITNIDGGDPVEMGGETLMQHGLPIQASEKPKAVVLVYSKDKQ